MDAWRMTCVNPPPNGSFQARYRPQKAPQRSRQRRSFMFYSRPQAFKSRTIRGFLRSSKRYPWKSLRCGIYGESIGMSTENLPPQRKIRAIPGHYSGERTICKLPSGRTPRTTRKTFDSMFVNRSDFPQRAFEIAVAVQSMRRTVSPGFTPNLASADASRATRSLNSWQVNRILPP